MILSLKAKNLKAKDNDQEKMICVATTHILYNPKRGDCKLGILKTYFVYFSLESLDF
jgi:hypothetical protein